MRQLAASRAAKTRSARQAAALGLMLLVAGCQINFGDAIQQGWVINDSSVPLVVIVQGVTAVTVPAHKSGGVYTEHGDPQRVVTVLDAATCQQLGETVNSKLLLLIRVGPSGNVTFEQGANLTPLTGVDLQPATSCLARATPSY